MPDLKEIRAEEERKKKAEEQRKRLGRIEVEARPETGASATKVEDIVSRMKTKYEARGYGQTAGKGAELKEKVAGKKSVIADQREPRDLAAGRGFAHFVGVLHGIPLINAMTWRIAGYGLAKRLPFALEKANMNYSAKQFVGMAVVVALGFSAFAALMIFALMFTAFSPQITGLAEKLVTSKGPLFAALAKQGISTDVLKLAVTLLLDLAATFFLSIFAFVFGVVIALQVPANKGYQRGKAIEKELPFALRHMATEIKAGIGIHKTLESIVEANYGELSIEFERALRDIDKGMTTEDALLALSERAPSENLSNAVMHMVRTLKTGGNLSEIIETIASEVSFELRMKMRDFVERLNLIGLFYMMVGIVFPVFVAILAGIFNAIPTVGLAGILGTEVLFLVYFILIPMALGVILYMIRIMQPM